MFKDTITYVDYDGNERTEDLYFNLTQAEVFEMELSHPGGFSAYLQKIVDSKDSRQIMATFKDLIRASYGVKEDGGRRFIKSEEVWLDFEQTEAYNVFFQKLFDADFAAKFVNGLMPPVPKDHQAPGGVRRIEPAKQN